MIGFDNPLIKELSEVVDIEQFREQLRREEQEDPPTSEYSQSETEYQLESEGGLTPPNESQNNQLLLNLNNNLPNNIAFNANAANTFTLALINLNMTLIAEEKKRKLVNYPTFSRRGDENINDFITELEKAFAVNKIADARKHLITISCLKGIAANFYDRLAGITNWNIVRQLANTQLRSALIVRFQSEA